MECTAAGPGSGGGEAGSLAEVLRGRPPMARELPSFDTGRAPDRPGPLFEEWLLGAVRAGVPDAQVVTLSTVDADGRPDARVLVLRDVDAERGAWWFAADADSPKGRQLAATPWAALTVYWPALGRQVRLRGRVETGGAEQAAADFRLRSPAARIAVLVGRQSERLDGDAELADAWREAEAVLDRDPQTVAPSHTLYAVVADEVEFWQGDPGRRHVRLAYTRNPDATWRRGLLWP
ncbi:pyridoxine/pyridoxamine 5'-phosphate oxidase [Peterkaempfera griseoplana]|uniref:pyridoxine/pyridoxamine 5'-phosphate oxidase n=1 Tax=Peterkaempfera griseoplana TaxID=66896 RepID=UPI0006E378FF|nr:pyridoxal 5'-phosphate synthase [Peterkaempfera griseoplana]